MTTIEGVSERCSHTRRAHQRTGLPLLPDGAGRNPYLGFAGLNSRIDRLFQTMLTIGSRRLARRGRHSGDGVPQHVGQATVRRGLEAVVPDRC